MKLLVLRQVLCLRFLIRIANSSLTMELLATLQIDSFISQRKKILEGHGATTLRSLMGNRQYFYSDS
jgi:hypothetical protein